jgi:hypothetical protein
MDTPAEHSEELPPVEAAEQLLAGLDGRAQYRALAGLVRDGHGSLLLPLDYDPAYSFHDPSTVVVQPEPVDPDLLDLYGRGAYPDFEEHLLAAFGSPELVHLLNDLYHSLVYDGINVALVTNHGQIIDIAVVLGALELTMCQPDRTFGVLGEQMSMADMAMRSNLLLSRMVVTRQVFGIPTPTVLSGMCRAFYSIPQTASRRRSKLDSDVCRANNLVMRDQLAGQLEKGGQILAMAASGSQDITLAANVAARLRTSWRARRGEVPNDAPSLHLQPLYNGTITLMLECRYVLPVSISLNREHPACVIGQISRVNEPDDCHDVMEWIAEAHEGATGIHTVYHRQEDDRLSRVRDAIRSAPREERPS